MLKTWWCLSVVFLLSSLAVADHSKYISGTAIQISTVIISSDLLVGTSPQSCCKIQVLVANSVYSVFVRGSKQDFSHSLGLAAGVQLRIKNHQVSLRFSNGKEVTGRLLAIEDLPNKASSDKVPSMADPTLALQNAQASMGVPIDVEVVAGNTSCILLSADLEAGEFFKNFSRETKARGREFRNFSGSVQFFPDRMTVRVLISVTNCLNQESEAGEEKRRDFALDDSLLGSLSFEGYWKKQQSLDRLPASLLPLTEAQICPQSALSENYCGWEYTFEVWSKKVPLAHTLVISVSSSDGKLVSRFSVRL